MPTATIERKPTKAQSANFFDRLAEHGRKDVQGALVQYRALAQELSRDSAYEFSPEDAAEILDALKLTAADLRHDAGVLALVRANEALLMTPAQIDALTVEAKAAADKLKANLAEIPLLRGKVREVEARRLTDAHARGEIGRTKASHCRLFGDAAEVERRIGAGQPTGPRTGGNAGDRFVADGSFSGCR